MIVKLGLKFEIWQRLKMCSPGLYTTITGTCPETDAERDHFAAVFPEHSFFVKPIR